MRLPTLASKLPDRAGVLQAAFAAVAIGVFHASHRSAARLPWLGWFQVHTGSEFHFHTVVNVALAAVGAAMALRSGDLTAGRAHPMSVLGWSLLGWWAMDGHTFAWSALFPERAPCLAGLPPASWGYWLQVTVSGPLVEEMLFRVLLLGALLRWVHPAVAVIAVAALFATLHDHQSLGMRLYDTFPTAIVFGAAWYYTRSLVVVWFAHGLGNALTLLALGALHRGWDVPICTD